MELILAIYSRPLGRAIDTVQPLATSLGVPVDVGRDRYEIDFGEDSYIPLEELEREDARAQLYRCVLTHSDSACRLLRRHHLAPPS